MKDRSPKNSPPASLEVAAARQARDVEELLTRARRQAVVRPDVPLRSVALWGGLFALCDWASFAPLDWGFLGWLAPAFVLMFVRAKNLPRWFYLVIFGCSFAGWVAKLQWMRLGDPTMVAAWIALAFYLAFYLPLVLAACRIAVHRVGVPLVLAAPIAWVSGEYVRAHFLTGFSWYYAGHTQYRFLELIQVSDIAGAYGVSFVVIAAAAALAEAIPLRWFSFAGSPRVSQTVTPIGANASPTRTEIPSLNFAPMSSIIVGSLVAATLGYGVWRRAEAKFIPGPRVALIQGNFPASLQANAADSSPIYSAHMRLTGLAVREQPDLVVWPESMFRWPLCVVPSEMTDADLEQYKDIAPVSFWRDPTVRNQLHQDSLKAGAALIYGLESVAPPPATPGVAGQPALPVAPLQFNSAVFITPEKGVTAHYDKMHRVPFGEYLPLQTVFPWLRAFTPYPPGWGLTAGQASRVFPLRSWRLAPVICFEDTVPHLVRRIVAEQSDSERGTPVDVLVNISNDGWFHGSSELEQHLVSAVFRAVECRTPVVRAVNTGISAFIDGDGAILNPEVFRDGANKGLSSPRDAATGRWHKQIDAAQISTVPLDDRTSNYVRYGDWFAQLCLVLMVLGTCAGLLVTPRKTPAIPSSPE